MLQYVMQRRSDREIIAPMGFQKRLILGWKPNCEPCDGRWVEAEVICDGGRRPICASRFLRLLRPSMQVAIVLLIAYSNASDAKRKEEPPDNSTRQVANVVRCHSHDSEFLPRRPRRDSLVTVVVRALSTTTSSLVSCLRGIQNSWIAPMMATKTQLTHAKTEPARA